MNQQSSQSKSLRWWLEFVYVGFGYFFYTSIRNINESSPQESYANALRIISWQKNLHIWYEQAWQEFALHWTPIIVAANYFYGSIYMLATISALVWLFKKFPQDYAFWRSVLMTGTLLALVGFALFPLMPPRLLSTMSTNMFTFVDTLEQYPTFWSFNRGAMKTISNQYAAMPSLHCGWSFWGFVVFYPRVKTWWGKTLAILYPIVTVTVVVITANHFFLDAVGGLFVFILAFFLICAFKKAPIKSTLFSR